MKTFGRVLLLGWILVVLGVALVFTFPKVVIGILHPTYSYFRLLVALLIAGTGVYKLIRVYQRGMTRK